jgi:hypothetical protein
VRTAELLQEAWAAATAGDPGRQRTLAVVGSSIGEIACDRQSAARALEHLLREALAQAPPDGPVEARLCRQGDARCIEIRVPAPARHGGDRAPAGQSLRVMLARSLLEMQGAGLGCGTDPAALWSAGVAFPAVRRPGRYLTGTDGLRPLSAGVRRPAAWQERRGG